MDIIKFRGTDKKLYEWVAPLVMNPAVLRQNNNYPFKTGPRYIWYISFEDEQITGFIPLKKTTTDKYIIDNYYIKGDDESILIELLSAVIADKSRQKELWATVHKRHVGLFAQNGFSTGIRWKNYEKMRYLPKEEETCIG